MYLIIIGVVVLVTIFGLTYSRYSFRSRENQRNGSSIIRLPHFLPETPLIRHPQGGVGGDSIVEVPHSDLQTEERSYDKATEPIIFHAPDRLFRDNKFHLERKLLEQKIKDANQLGLCADFLWPHELQKNLNKANDLLGNPYTSSTSEDETQ